MGVIVDTFRQELNKLEWIEGKNITIELRFADQKRERLRDLASELVRLKGGRDCYEWFRANACG